LNTLLEWQVETNDGLAQMGVPERNQQIEELEMSLALLINASNQVKDMQVNLQASFDSLRQQYFKLMDATDKHAFI